MDYEIVYTEDALRDLEVMLNTFVGIPPIRDPVRQRSAEPRRTASELSANRSPCASPARLHKILHSPIRIYDWIREEKRLIEVLHFWHGARRIPQLRY